MSTSEEREDLKKDLTKLRYATEDWVKKTAGSMTPATYAGEESVTFSNGLIVKQGLDTVAATSVAITFGTAFPTAISNIQLTAKYSSNPLYVLVDNDPAPALTGFTLLKGAGAVAVYWQAWGY